MQTHTNSLPKPILVTTPGVIPEHLRGIIHSTPAADKLISERALQGPARNGRKKYKGRIQIPKFVLYSEKFCRTSSKSFKIQ